MKLYKRCTFILGGARSGKSRLAQEMATKVQSVLFVATAEPLDVEMRVRISEHRRTRPGGWRTVEAPTGVGAAIVREHRGEEVVVVDCLTLLISNLFTRNGPKECSQAEVDAEVDELVRAIDTVEADFIIVSNEVGLGLVPDNPLGRTYRDALGKVNHALAARAGEVFFMVAGLPLKIK
ncbi:MAG: bifunctional adenosylcobinamide kinase/adenosylcobinamide-phosphate guanylyltransferase [Dehalococcoidia bacterium]|nr:bifunctional adenosylcobinamide kinase/adenosylcobinamide-phosphate guanylyltransferase [Dehalococcoidia bacterium]